MLDHFDVEEKTALLLMRAYFGPEETSDLQRKVLEDAPENSMGALIHAMGEDCFRSEFMKEQVSVLCVARGVQGQIGALSIRHGFQGGCHRDGRGARGEEGRLVQLSLKGNC